MVACLFFLTHQSTHNSSMAQAVRRAASKGVLVKAFAVRWDEGVATLLKPLPVDYGQDDDADADEEEDLDE